VTELLLRESMSVALQVFSALMITFVTAAVECLSVRMYSVAGIVSFDSNDGYFKCFIVKC